MFPYLPVAKFAVQAISSVGVSQILVGIVKNNVTVVTLAQKVTVRMGTLVLGSMLVDQTAKHIEELATTAAALYESRKEETEENSE